MSYFAYDRMGSTVPLPDVTQRRRLLDSLGREDPEHPDVSLTHESGWTISVFSSGLIVFENVETGEGPWHKQEGTFSGNALDPRSYHAYGEKVLAVADGTVVAVHDGLLDNVPRTAAGFSSTLPITMETIGGNDLTLDLGDGQFAYYAHLQAGSLRVKAGDLVRRGMVLGRIGNSGDSREPHLHFQVMNTPSNFAAEGVPYVIEQYWVRLADDTWGKRAHELPVMGALVNFEPLQPGAIEEL